MQYRFAPVFLSVVTLAGCGDLAAALGKHSAPANTSSTGSAGSAAGGSSGDSSGPAGNGSTDPSATQNPNSVGTDPNAAQNPNAAGTDPNATQSPNEVCTVVANQELFITALPVVEDSVRTQWDGSSATTGAWQLGRVLARLGAPGDGPTFVSNWLALLTNNTKTVVADAWPLASNGLPDLSQAPARLLAIVNRLDLRDPTNGKFGELRFVYGNPVTARQAVADGYNSDVKIIVECNVHASQAYPNATSWAKAWHHLANYSSWSDPNARNALATITQNITDGAQAMDCRIRTADESFNQNWEFLQFELDANRQPQSANLTLTPQLTLNQTLTQPNNASLHQLADFIDANASQIHAGTYQIPDTFQGTTFGTPSLIMPIDYGRTPSQNGRFWTAPLAQDQNAVAILSANTCNGCHSFGHSPQKVIPSHVTNRPAGVESGLSDFVSNTQFQARSADMSDVMCKGTGDQTPGGVFFP